MVLSTLNNTAGQVSAAAANAFHSVGHAFGHAWTYVSNNTVAVWDATCAAVASAWASTQPVLASVPTLAYQYPVQVAIIVGLAVISTLVARAICNRLP